MAENTKIEWCDHTVNLWHGCAKVHTGCKNCYAEAMSKRWKFAIWGENAPRREIKSAFRDLKKYENHARENGFKEVVFCGSMMDIFEKPKWLTDNGDKGGIFHLKTNTLRDILFKEITDGKYNNLIFLFLTKRPQNINKFIPEIWKSKLPKNVWFGTSVSDQKTAEELIPKLMENTPKSANLFLSVEPQTDAISLTNLKLAADSHYLNCLSGTISFPIGSCDELKSQRIKWVIQGGESGNKKRPFKTEWAFLLKSQCAANGTDYFFKQIDGVKPIPPILNIKQKPF